MGRTLLPTKKDYRNSDTAYTDGYQKERTASQKNIAQNCLEIWISTQPDLEIRVPGKVNTYRLL